MLGEVVLPGGRAWGEAEEVISSKVEGSVNGGGFDLAPRGQQRRATRLVSWLEIQQSLLASMRNPWLDPFTLQPGIMQVRQDKI